jgi:hypothetical protein
VDDAVLPQLEPERRVHVAASWTTTRIQDKGSCNSTAAPAAEDDRHRPTAGAAASSS